jgi:hypothetical protein
MTVPVINEKVNHTVNLPAQLETVKNVSIQDSFKTKNGFTVFVRPLTYKDVTETQVKTFEQQKIVASVSTSTLAEEEKAKRYAEAYKKLTGLNFEIMSTSFTKIITPDGTEVVDKNQIREFLNNAESKIVNEMQEQMITLRSQAQIKPIRLKATEEQIKKGAPVSYEVPLTFDNSNFFV